MHHINFLLKQRFILMLLLSAGFSLLSCQSDTSGEEGLTSIQPEDFEKHIKILASDEFGGRKPFTEGEEKTVQYLRNEFENMGLLPGNGDSYFQEVPLVEVNATPDTTMSIQPAKGKVMNLSFNTDYVIHTRRITKQIDVKDAEMVFCGFGIVAPEYGWNDYEGIDMKGKIAVVMINDPGFGSSDSTFFKGNTMTYYGRWTYKFEEAARQGAEGVIIIHNNAPAGYPWAVVQSSWTGKLLYLQPEDNNNSRCAIEGWMTTSASRKLFAAVDLKNPLGKAREKGFKPISLELTASTSMTVDAQFAKSRNVLAKMEGSEHPDEYIIYTAHWDHIGTGNPVEGDSIYNGALDNATGTAGLLEIAQAFSRLSDKPERSVLFLAVTAEEQGLLGSEYYAQHPVYPLEKTVADINMDGLGFYGPMKDVTIVGYGQSDLEEYAAVAAKEQDRYIMPDQKPEKGHFFRSDHFSFAKAGVPALYASGEHEQAEKGVEWTKARSDEWVAKNYHQPSDEVEDSWDYSGMVKDAQLLFSIGFRLSNERNFPAWKEGSEFKATRDAYMAQ